MQRMHLKIFTAYLQLKLSANSNIRECSHPDKEIRDIYQNLQQDIILNGKRLSVSLLKLGKKQKSLLSPLLFSIVAEILSSAIREEKEIKRHRIGKTDNH